MDMKCITFDSVSFFPTDLASHSIDAGRMTLKLALLFLLLFLPHVPDFEVEVVGSSDHKACCHGPLDRVDPVRVTLGHGGFWGHWAWYFIAKIIIPNVPDAHRLQKERKG